MTIATEVSVTNAHWLARLMAEDDQRAEADEQRRHDRHAARPETRAMCVPNGRRPSRAIENSMRMQAAHHGQACTRVIAIAESIRNTLPVVLPSACLMM